MRPNGPHIFYPFDRVRSVEGDEAVVLEATPLRAVLRHRRGVRPIEQGDPEWSVTYSAGVQCHGCGEWMDGSDWTTGRICGDCEDGVE